MKKIKNMFISRKADPLDEILSEISPFEENRVRNRMRIAANIDRLLKERNWNKSALANKLDKQNSEITKWMSGAHNFTGDTLSDIALVFGVKLSDLVEEYITPVVYSDNFIVKAVAFEARKKLSHFDWSELITTPLPGPNIHRSNPPYYFYCVGSETLPVAKIEGVTQSESWRYNLSHDKKK